MASQKVIADLLTEIQALYPNWNATAETGTFWAKYLTEIEDSVLVRCVDVFVKTSEHSFAPSINDILRIAREIKKQDTPPTPIDTPLSRSLADGVNYAERPPRNKA